MTVQLRAGGSSGRAAAAPSQRVIDASARLERDAIAGVLAHEQLRAVLAELTPEHFYDPLHRDLRAYIVDGAELDAEGLGLLAEFDAHAEREGIDESTAPSSCCACGSVSCGASCSTPTRAACANCRRRCSACSRRWKRSRAS